MFTDWDTYTSLIRAGRYKKLCRVRFLNPNGSPRLVIDNDPMNPETAAFVESGSVSVNLQNGVRRTASITLANADGTFDFSASGVWFGTEIAIDMGILMPDGTEFYIPQGVYRVVNPSEDVQSDGTRAQFSLTDKWAGIDGTLNGVLESTYAVNAGTNIFSPIASILKLDRGDGRPFDNVTPIFTEYYNGKSQALPGGGTAALTDAPYDLLVDSDNGTVADVVLGLCAFVNAWVGYDRSGRLRIDPSQDDILDTDKPVSWRFSADEAQIISLAYEAKVQDVVNDYIVLGNMTSDYVQPAARAVNADPRSDTNVNLIGRRTVRDPRPDFGTVKMCADYAEWKLKRQAALMKAVEVRTNQIFHIDENTIIEIVRTDKPGNPVEQHLVMGFTLPISSTEPMTIQAVSVHDFPSVTVYTNE